MPIINYHIQAKFLESDIREIPTSDPIPENINRDV